MSPDIRNRMITIVAAVVVAFLFLLPTFAPSTFEGSKWFSKPISLGLDLSGGVYLVYEVQTEEAVKARLERDRNALRSELRRENIPVSRARVTDNAEVELQLFRSQFLEQAKTIIARANPDLVLRDESKDGDGARLRYYYEAAKTAEIERRSVEQAVETLRSRVDQFGVAEPLIQRAGERRIILQMPGVSDIEAVKRIVGSVAQLEFRFLPNAESRRYQIYVQDKQTGEQVAVEDEVQMTGEMVDRAEVSVTTGQVEVLLTLTTEGARQFRRITTDGVGRPLGIILDGQLFSAPEIREPIGGGVATISGGFTMQEAHELAIVLRAGALPAPLIVERESLVGPTLGGESIVKGLEAIGIGFTLVILFMLFYYGKSGIVAVSSLALVLLLVSAALAALGATLTLPGLAGLALTVGMAVDANVIIFERIREELRIGASRNAAVQAGFDKAFSAIMDANLTTLLTAVILYIFGTGPIRGFAVTLSFGILATLFCATVVTRLAFDAFELKGRKGLSI
jgi:preprotein translocase subunit SecD